MRCVCSFVLIVACLIKQSWVITLIAGKLRSCSSSKKCIWASNRYEWVGGSRSAKAIDRLLIILPLAHFFFAFRSSFLLPLGQAIRRFRALLCTF